MEFSWCPRQQVLRWKYSLDQYRTFKGPQKIHLVGSIIVKACEDRIDPIKDMAQKKISPRCSRWAAIYDGKNMASEIIISCLGDGSYIGDPDFICPKSRLQPKFQGWARVSQVLKIVTKFKSKFKNICENLGPLSLSLSRGHKYSYIYTNIWTSQLLDQVGPVDLVKRGWQALSIFFKFNISHCLGQQFYTN